MRRLLKHYTGNTIVAEDCYEHPEHLKRVLNYIYRDTHVLTESLKIGLREFTQDASIARFLEIIGK